MFATDLIGGADWGNFNSGSGLNRDRRDWSDKTAKELGWTGVTWNGYKIPQGVRVTDIPVRDTTALSQVQNWDEHDDAEVTHAKRALKRYHEKKETLTPKQRLQRKWDKQRELWDAQNNLLT